jgi:hypothetical protein
MTEPKGFDAIMTDVLKRLENLEQRIHRLEQLLKEARIA